ncbi:hypothetical protein OHU29_40940 [Streptomyces canus]
MAMYFLTAEHRQPILSSQQRVLSDSTSQCQCSFLYWWNPNLAALVRNHLHVGPDPLAQPAELSMPAKSMANPI